MNNWNWKRLNPFAIMLAAVMACVTVQSDAGAKLKNSTLVFSAQADTEMTEAVQKAEGDCAKTTANLKEKNDAQQKQLEELQKKYDEVSKKPGGDSTEVAGLRKQVEDLQKQLAETTRLLDVSIKECHPGVDDAYIAEWKKNHGLCSDLPKPKTAKISADYCEEPAVKDGNGCKCPESTKVEGIEPRLVRITIKNKRWENHLTCIHDARVTMALEANQKRLCEPLDVGAKPDAKLCEEASKALTRALVYLKRLRTMTNGVPGFDREQWEEIYNLVHLLQAELDGLKARVQALEEWRAEKDAKDKEQDERLDGIGKTSWLVGPEVSYAYRMGRVPGSVRGAVKFDIYHRFSKVVAMSMGPLAGGALNEWSNRYLIGGEFRTHFSVSEIVAITVGLRTDFEVVRKAVDAGAGYLTLGLDIRPVPTFFIEPSIGFGGNIVKLYEDGHRHGDTSGNVFLFALALGYASPTAGDAKIPPSSVPAKAAGLSRRGSIGTF